MQIRFLAYAAGVYISLIAYSLVQERIMTVPFGTNGETFGFSLFLVLANRLTTCAAAFLVLQFNRHKLGPQAPLYTYLAVSASNVLATTLQYEALKYVMFPVQTLGKCAKMIPVMLWGTLISKKIYKSRDYVIALAVTFGCTLFLTAGEVTSRTKEQNATSGVRGILFMAGYLACDGFTSNFQSNLFKGYKTTVYNQTLYTSLVSAAFSIFGLLGSEQFSGAYNFIWRHPGLLPYVLLLSCASTSGQIFIVHTIEAFGALPLAMLMSTRQFISLLLSSFIFAHPLSLGQWAGTGVVFAAIFVKTMRTGSARKGVQKPRMTAAEDGGASNTPPQQKKER